MIRLATISSIVLMSLLLMQPAPSWSEDTEKAQQGSEGAGVNSSGTTGHQSLSDRPSAEPGGSAPRTLRPDAPARAGEGMSAVPSRECNDCQLMRGKVLAVDQNTLIIKEASKKAEVHLRLTKDTIPGQENSQFGGFMEGDQIEAYVQPNGEVHSITIRRHPGGRPGPDEIGG